MEADTRPLPSGVARRHRPGPGDGHSGAGHGNLHPKSRGEGCRARFLARMLAIGRRKVRTKGLSRRIDLTLGDARRLPFRAGSFDGATMAFASETSVSETMFLGRSGVCSKQVPNSGSWNLTVWTIRCSESFIGSTSITLCRP